MLTVIAGDKYCKDGTEQEQSVISRLAQRKVASQFDDYYLDGLGKHAAEVCKEEDYVRPQAINILQEMAECDDSGAKQKEEMGKLIPLNCFCIDISIL